MDNDDNNPFADPRLRQPTASTSTSPPQSNDNNPFATPITPTQPAPPPQQPSPAAYLTPSQPPTYQPSAYTPVPTPVTVQQPTDQYANDRKPTSATYVDVGQFERRQTELEEREKRLAERERVLANAEGVTGRVNNFPPIPKFCPCKSCFFQDISLEIPVEFQRWVRYTYYLWFFYILTLFLNMLTGLSHFLTDGSGISTFGLALVYMVLFIPLSYICWFRPLYRAFKNDSSVFFMLFFFIDIMFIITNILFALGVIDGMCGFFRSGSITNTIVKFMMIVLGGLWSLISAATIVLTIKIHRLYRQSGASLEQAQKEFQTAFVNNPTVRGAAREVATAGINESLRSDADQGRIY